MHIQLKGRGRLLFSFQFLSLLCTALIVGVGIATAATYALMRQRVTNQTNLKFEEITNGHVHELFHHFETYSNALYAARGLFASAKVNAASWNDFIHAQNAPQRFVGMKALAYAEVVPRERIGAYERTLQKAQHTSISIHPLRDRGDYIVLTYHEDVSLGESERLNALGFDLASNPERYDAIKRANNGDAIVATGRIPLATNGATGFLLLLPLTDRFGNDNAQQPFGYSIAAFEMEKFVHATIGSRLEQYKTFVQITDITDDKNIPLYTGKDYDGRYVVSRNVTLQVADRTWRITFKAPSSSLVMVTERFAPTTILAVGAGLIVVICIAVYTLRLRYRLLVLVATEENRKP
jgi:CHASE1-domain containing sensor protein